MITKPLLASLRIEMNEALAAVAKKHGIAISVGSCSFTDATATYKLLIADGAQDGESAQHVKARADFKSHAMMFGLDPDWLGATFLSNGTTYTIVGLYPKKRKQPVVVTKGGDARFVMSAEDVALRMARQAAAKVPA
jgi:hypothetical protein